MPDTQQREEFQEKPLSELYRVSRAQIEHHDNAVNQRVIWLSIGQSFFFNVYAMLVTAKAPTPPLFAKQQMLAVIFPIAALLVAIFSFIDVIAGLFYMRKLRTNYKGETDGSSHENYYPMLNGNRQDRFFQRISPVMIPFIFIVTWVYLLMFDHQLL
jgi:H+/gluconate symporter-like permease